ncbi:MAG: molecular chaperone HtpG [Eubacteriales bacterium]
MAKKQFKSESKRLLDLMIHSIYTHKEIFLRELISNASDAIDKLYYKALMDDNMSFKRDDYFIKINFDKKNRILSIADTGIGMSKEELESNLGTIAKSGSLTFKDENEKKDGIDIIGQFGVGFYSSFMVSDQVTVISRALGSDTAYKWESFGADGYTIEECTKSDTGTEVILKIKENDDEENYDQYLEDYRLRNIIKKYSDFIRYPIKMQIVKSQLKEGTSDEYEEKSEETTINSMVPIWRRNKSELTDEDYENFYSEKHYSFDKPLKHMHIHVDGAISYDSILFIPSKTPFDYYTKDYEKGLELYSSGVLIMNKCPELLPDYFSFVKGMVDSEDLSLNISREMLQHNRQLTLIAKNLKTKIKNALLDLMKSNRPGYEEFFASFGRQLKFGVYDNFGSEKETLADLILFYSSKEDKLVSLDEYVERMKENQKHIYYIAGESIEKIKKLPKMEWALEQGFEILYLVEEIDEFAIKILMNHKGKDFQSLSGADLIKDSGGENDDSSDSVNGDETKEIFESMKKILENDVTDVRASKRLKSHPVCLTNEGDLSIEMEKILNAMPNSNNIKAEKVLEINKEHVAFEALKNAFNNDKEKFALYTKLLFNQALLLEGLSVGDPLEFSNDICKLMK